MNRTQMYKVYSEHKKRQEDDMLNKSVEYYYIKYKAFCGQCEEQEKIIDECIKMNGINPTLIDEYIQLYNAESKKSKKERFRQVCLSDTGFDLAKLTEEEQPQRQ